MNRIELEERLIDFSVKIIDISNHNNQLISIFVTSIKTFRDDS